MPKVLRPETPAVVPLYQVTVETRTGTHRPIGPKMMRPMADELAAAIRKQIVLGNEREWSNPTVALAMTRS